MNNLISAKKKWLKYILFTILVLAFLLRVSGITYGLPLWLIGDEAPFVLGALKMLELKTLIPALNTQNFQNILYFPPYISYLYLLPFTALLGIKYLLFSSSLPEFKNLIAADPSEFFIIARFFSVLSGTATVWLVYKTGKNLFKSELAAVLSAAFLGLSYMHANFSHWGRHWIPATFVFALIICILSREDLKNSKKYILASVVAGLGTGINYQTALSVVFIFLWFVFYDKLFSLKVFKEKWIYYSIAIFLILGFLAYFLYPGGLVVGKSNLALEKSFKNFLKGYGFYFSTLFHNDPAISLFAALGFLFGLIYSRRYFFVSLSFIFIYIAVFYLIFFHVDRYILMVMPLLALTAGFGAFSLFYKFNPKFRFLPGALIFFSLIFMLIMIFKFDFILLKNDSRIQAIKWFNSNISENSKVAVLVCSMKLSTTITATKELELIDPRAIRKTDLAELNIAGKKRYHALNLTNVKSEDFFKDFKEYIEKEKYEYLISSNCLSYKEQMPDIKNLGAPIKIFKGYSDEKDDAVNWFSGWFKNDKQNIYYTTPAFGGRFKRLLNTENNGPEIIISKLR